VPIQIADWPSVYMDLRDWGAQGWFQNSPWSHSPREPDEQAVIRRFVRAGDVVCDIGANVGLHTALFSSIVGPSGEVYAFEPSPRVIPALTRTIQGMDHTRLFLIALSDEDGDAELFVPEGGNNMNASLAFWTDQAGEVTRVRCVRRALDSLMKTERLRPPSFIKCDVEGGELKVFQGATGILNQRDAPVVLFEANVYASKGFGVGVSAARDFLAALPEPNYTFFTVAEAGRLVHTEQLHPVNSNVVAIPLPVLKLHPDLG